MIEERSITYYTVTLGELTREGDATADIAVLDSHMVGQGMIFPSVWIA